MATAQSGIIFVPSNSAELRTQFLQDVLLAARALGVEDPPVEPGSDWWLQAETSSRICIVGLANIAIHAKAASVLDAEGEDLEAIRIAFGLPEVQAQGSSGKVHVTVSGSTTIPNGMQGKIPNGLRIQTVGTVINPSDQQEIDVAAIDTGAATNLKGGEFIQWISPPTNVATEAKVSSSFPLTGGTDTETDARKRDRILNTLRNKPAAGNWGYLRQLVQDNHGNVDDTYVMPAPGGPSSQLIVPTRPFDIENNDYSRAPSSALIQAIRSFIQSDSNVGIETVVRAAANELVDFTVLADIPQSTLSGGNGQGWTDPSPWPSLVPADSNTVTITAVDSDNDSLTLDAQTTTAPVDGQTHVAWWSAADRKFYTGLVLTHSGSAGAWVVNLDRPLVGKDGVGPQVGDYVCPAAQNLSAYGDTWVSIFSEFGPGEVTSDVNRLPRSRRHPYTDDEDPAAATNAALAKLIRNHPEMTDAEFGHAPQTSPTVPASVDDPPNILVPRRFAVYPA